MLGRVMLAAVLVAVGTGCWGQSFQPDIMIRAPGDITYRGDGVFYTTRINQTESEGVQSGGKATYQLRVRNLSHDPTEKGMFTPLRSLRSQLVPWPAGASQDGLAEGQGTGSGKILVTSVDSSHPLRNAYDRCSASGLYAISSSRPDFVSGMTHLETKLDRLNSQPHQKPNKLGSSIISGCHCSGSIST